MRLLTNVSIYKKKIMKLYSDKITKWVFDITSELKDASHSLKKEITSSDEGDCIFESFIYLLEAVDYESPRQKKVRIVKDIIESIKEGKLIIPYHV